MRLWHYKLLNVLPKKMIVSQWRECVAIKRQWEKNTLKHSLVNYVLDYPKELFAGYVLMLVTEMQNRGIKYKKELLEEIIEFTGKESFSMKPYPEHNERYLGQCIYNLEEKWDRGIIGDEEWQPIEKLMYNKIMEENDE